MNDPAPANPWAPIGLPAQWAPAPVAWSFAKMQANGPNGAETVHLLILDSANGRHAFAFPAPAWATLIRMMQEQSTGLSVVNGDALNVDLRRFKP